MKINTFNANRYQTEGYRSRNPVLQAAGAGAGAGVRGHSVRTHAPARPLARPARGSPQNTKQSLHYLVRCSGELEFVSQQVNFCWGQTSSSRSSGCESKLARSKSLQNRGKLGEIWERLNHCKFTKWPCCL